MRGIVRRRVVRGAAWTGGLVLASGLAVLVAGAVEIHGQGAVRVTPEAPRAPAPAPEAPPEIGAREAVEDVVARFRLAFSALDAAAARAVWPAVDEGALAHAFRQLQAQELTFAECQTVMEPAGTRGTVICRGSVRFVPKIGPRAERVQLRRWEFVVSRSAADWRIQSVESAAEPQR